MLWGRYPLPSAWQSMPASSRCCASICSRVMQQLGAKIEASSDGAIHHFRRVHSAAIFVNLVQLVAIVWGLLWPVPAAQVDLLVGCHAGPVPCVWPFFTSPALPLRCNGGQIFRAAHPFAVRQPNPQTGAFDDDVVHAHRSAFVEKLRAGFVQNHSCDVSRWDVWVMTASPGPQWCQQMGTRALRLGKRAYGAVAFSSLC